MQNYIEDPILLEIRSKQAAPAATFSDEGARTSSSAAREVLKDKKIKRLNDISRAEAHREERTNLSSTPIGRQTSSSNTSPEGLVGAEEDCRNIGPATTSSRAYTGISVQHAKTAKGTKLYITVQTAERAEAGQWLTMTAELKHRKRFREIKDYEGDSPAFKEFVREAIDFFRTKTDEDWYVGRAHERKQRSAWFEDTLIIARMEFGRIVEVKVCMDDECYDITLDLELSASQIAIFHSSGLYGNLKKAKQAPSRHTAKWSTAQ
jgi:hypothetical protein